MGIMEIIRDRNKRDSAIAVMIISLLLILAMVLLGPSVPDPPLETGIEISFGTEMQGDGDTPPEEVNVAESEEIPEEITESTPVPTESQEVVETQEAEETIAVPEEAEAIEETEVIDEVPEQEVDQNALYPGKTNNNSSDDSQGNTGDPGDMGSTEGGDNTNYSGSTDGNQHGFALSGRSITFRPKLTNATQETGKVVVNIWVDRYGKVKRATPGAKGSTTTNSQLYKIAKAAAMKAKFSANSKAPEEQKGTIVFEFLSGR